MACSIEVPVAWFEAGATLQIHLPRLLQCARCEGGGCDACERRGAFELQAAGIAREVEVVLPKPGAQGCSAVKLRLPGLGARVAKPAEAAGAEPRVAAPVAVPEPLVTAGEAPRGETTALALVDGAALARIEALEPPVAAGEEAAAASEGPAAVSEELPSAAPGEPPALPPGHLLLTVVPRVPGPGWAPPSNVQALIPAPPAHSSWQWLELLLFPDRLLAALRAWWQTRAPAALRTQRAWFWAALAVVVIVSGCWLLTRSGSRSQ